MHHTTYFVMLELSHSVVQGYFGLTVAGINAARIQHRGGKGAAHVRRHGSVLGGSEEEL